MLERDYQKLDKRRHDRWLKSSPELARCVAASGLPKNLVGKAPGYLDSQWPKLRQLFDDGALPIHNNPVENTTRPFVIGCKNGLFSASTKGAEASAVNYGLVDAIKANDLEPSFYLPWLFHTLPNTDPNDTEALRALPPYEVDRDHLVN